jgi:hypothetical protein
VGTLSRRQAHRVRSGESPEPRPLPSLRMERLRIPADAERAGHVSSTLDPLDLLILVHALASAMSPPPPPCAASPPRTRPRPSGSPPHCAAIATAARAITAATPVHEAAGSTTDARTYVRLRQSGGWLTSRLTTFRGPLVAQTSIGRLAQPRGAESASGRKMPANSPRSKAFVAGRRRARLGLSRRRSRVRVPSLPSFEVPANRHVALSQ